MPRGIRGPGTVGNKVRGNAIVCNGVGYSIKPGIHFRLKLCFQNTMPHYYAWETCFRNKHQRKVSETHVVNIISSFFNHKILN